MGGSMNAAEQFIAAPGASEKKNSSSEDDNGTVIGLAIMGIAMLSLVVIAAVVLKRRSSRKNGGKNVSNSTLRSKTTKNFMMNHRRHLPCSPTMNQLDSHHHQHPN